MNWVPTGPCRDQGRVSTSNPREFVRQEPAAAPLKPSPAAALPPAAWGTRLPPVGRARSGGSRAQAPSCGAPVRPAGALPPASGGAGPWTRPRLRGLLPSPGRGGPGSRADRQRGGDGSSPDPDPAKGGCSAGLRPWLAVGVAGASRSPQTTP